jgi:hypothetical protein
VNPPEATLAEHDRALHPSRARPDHENIPVGVLGRLEALRVPAAPVLLARGRVLSAAEVMATLRLRDADVAADALPDLAVKALFHLGGKEGIGDRRAGRSDQVPGTRVDDLCHAIRIGQASDTHDRLGSGLADAAGPLELVPLREESRGAGVLRPFGDRADIHVPEID